MRPYESLNYYELLGVPESATAEEIRSAYREMARAYHPDSTFYDEIVVSRTSDESRKLFQIITTAFSTLIDDEKRGFYDRTLRQEMARRRTAADPPGRRTMTLRRDVLLSQLEAEVPSYNEIEGLGEMTSSVADIIKSRQSTATNKAIYLFLFIAAVTVVVIALTLSS